jgi:enterochelin esterase family protein
MYRLPAIVGWKIKDSTTYIEPVDLMQSQSFLDARGIEDRPASRAFGLEFAAPREQLRLMNLRIVFHFLALLTIVSQCQTVMAGGVPAAPTGTDLYKLGPDSKRQEGVPQGKILTNQITSQVYEGRVFTNRVYVPAQYDGSSPAAVMVFQDGNGYIREFQDNGSPGAWCVGMVFDNLIHKKQMPVTIGIFIDPSSPQDRSMEYDTLSDRYARFLIEEMLPEVGKSYKLTLDPDGRAIAGLSSGAICAFTVAWERPDAFRKVASFYGSFTSIAYRPGTNNQPVVFGGEIYPTLIRRTPIKPLTIFIQD